MSFDYSKILGSEGPLASQISGFQPRKAQQELAEAVHEAIENKTVLVSEAETGTGKTFAYLIPALLSQKKIIISTGTKNLQDQLFHRDLPTIRKSLAIPLKVALLKGRSNYLCLYRLETNAPDQFSVTRSTLSEFTKIQTWASQTSSGDLAEVSSLPEAS